MADVVVKARFWCAACQPVDSRRRVAGTLVKHDASSAIEALLHCDECGMMYMKRRGTQEFVHRRVALDVQEEA